MTAPHLPRITQEDLDAYERESYRKDGWLGCILALACCTLTVAAVYGAVRAIMEVLTR